VGPPMQGGACLAKDQNQKVGKRVGGERGANSLKNTTEVKVDITEPKKRQKGKVGCRHRNGSQKMLRTDSFTDHVGDPAGKKGESRRGGRRLFVGLHAFGLDKFKSSKTSKENVIAKKSCAWRKSGGGEDQGYAACKQNRLP